MNHVDLATLLLRVVLGVTMLAHGYNHLLGPGGVAGTARWFQSLGLRPPIVHAWTSGLLECGLGVALLAGFLTPLSCAGVVGIMAVAGVAAHRPNGFFVFREGYEYVLFVAVAAVALAVLGPGQWSLDSALPSLPAGAAGLAIAAGAGLGGCALLLAASWRPHSSPVAETVLDEPLTAQDSRR